MGRRPVLSRSWSSHRQPERPLSLGKEDQTTPVRVIFSRSMKIHPKVRITSGFGQSTAPCTAFVECAIRSSHSGSNSHRPPSQQANAFDAARSELDLFGSGSKTPQLESGRSFRIALLSGERVGQCGDDRALPSLYLGSATVPTDAGPCASLRTAICGSCAPPQPNFSST